MRNSNQNKQQLYEKLSVSAEGKIQPAEKGKNEVRLIPVTKSPLMTFTCAADPLRGAHRWIWPLIRYLIWEATVFSHLLEQVWTYSAENPRLWTVLIETGVIFWNNTRKSIRTTWRCWKILKKSPIILKISGNHVCVVFGNWSDDQGWATFKMELSQMVDDAGIPWTDAWIYFLHERERFIPLYPIA